MLLLDKTIPTSERKLLQQHSDSFSLFLSKGKMVHQLARKACLS